MIELSELTAQARRATEELLEAAHLETGDIFVVGCSSSEIRGGRIGHDSSMEVAAAVLAGVLPPLQEQGVYLAAQCCEHLNRSIVIEREAAKKYGCQIVAAIPQPHAGGSWATNCWRTFKDPVLVEEVKARLPQAELLAVGTNGIASSAMQKAGASQVATGENPVVRGVMDADVVLGPLGIVVAHAILGEVTPKMAEAVGGCRAKKFLVPMNSCGVVVAGVQELSLSAHVRQAVDRAVEFLEGAS